jgi:heme/copper-type cytochrome/quinol oxidase subunit 2
MAGKNWQEGDDPMSEAQQPDALKNLIWFIIGLAILGTVIALAIYFAVELPARQAALTAPANYAMGSYGMGWDVAQNARI